MSAQDDPQRAEGALRCATGCGAPVDEPGVCPACQLRLRAARTLARAGDRQERKRQWERARAARRRDHSAAFALLPVEEQARLLTELDHRRGWTR
jgi:hypothetical protein